MRYFDRAELARRYHSYRPRVHTQVIQEIAARRPPRAFDLVMVSMAFHWLDQQRFLGEAARVLVPGGEFWVYNLLFPGVLLGDEAFSAWQRERYLPRYPVPARHWATLASLLQPGELPLAFADEQKLRYEVSFTATELRCYLTTQSNIEAALRRGDSLRDVDAWLDDELAPFFGDSASHRFLYIGSAEIAVAV